MIATRIVVALIAIKAWRLKNGTHLVIVVVAIMIRSVVPNAIKK
jgi:hypothetical protein